MIPGDLPSWILLLFLFILGTFIGSFLNVCIYRIPQHEQLTRQLRGLWSPPSSCPTCGNRIAWYDNVPIVGWLKLRGRCRLCKARISSRYPLIELFNGLLFVVVYWFEVPFDWHASIADSCVYSPMGPEGIIGSKWFSPAALLNLRYAYHMLLLEALVVATFIDIDRMIIPDAATLPAMVVGVLGGWAYGQMYLVPVWFQDPSIMRSLRTIFPEGMHGLIPADSRVPDWIAQFPQTHGLLVPLAGLVVGGGIVWGVRVIGQWILRREAMGFGDVILMALIGSFLGWQPAIIIFFIAPLCALLVVATMWIVRRDREIPYGPYLSIGTLIVILGWKQVWPIFEPVFGWGPMLPVMALVMAALLIFSLLSVQWAKRLLGVPLHPQSEWNEVWTSADQLTHFAGETIDLQQGRWKTPDWPGTAAGRGRKIENEWRRGAAENWKQNWFRRIDD